MKKALVMGLCCLIVLNASALTVQAASQTRQCCSISGCDIGDCFRDGDGDGICGDHCFVDDDGDGVCDNHCYTDEDGDGICDGFVDDDGDGICDHCHEHGKPAQTDCSRGTRRQKSHHGRHHGGCH